MGKVNINAVGLRACSSVAVAYKCTWSDGKWRFRWEDESGKRHTSKDAFPDDKGFDLFADVEQAVRILGFHSVVSEDGSKA